MTLSKKFPNIFLLFIAFSIPMFFTNCGGDDDASPSSDISVITPGQGIGNDITLNLTSSGVEDILGEGQKNIIDVIFISVQTLTYADLGIAVAFNPGAVGATYDDNASVIGYSVVSPYDGATPEGIKIGSSREDVVAAYGEPNSIDSDGLEEYTTRGVNFEYIAGNVSSISIY